MVLGRWPDIPPHPRQVMAVIRSLVAESRIVVLDHAEQRMIERDIDQTDLELVLRIGDIVGTIKPGRGLDEWTCKVVAAPRYPSMSREVGVVTIIVADDYLLIKTVEWEDEA